MLTGGGGGHAPRPASTAEPPQASPSPGSPSGTQSTAPARSAATAAATFIREQLTGPAGVAAAAGRQPSGPGPGRAARVTRGRVAAGVLQAYVSQINFHQVYTTEKTTKSYHWIPHSHQRWSERSSGSCHFRRLLHGPWRGEFSFLILALLRNLYLLYPVRYKMRLGYSFRTYPYDPKFGKRLFFLFTCVLYRRFKNLDEITRRNEESNGQVIEVNVVARNKYISHERRNAT